MASSIPSAPRLCIVLGATASGKERLALSCAERLDGEIVSVDSMKIYRGLDIATAKAGARERERVRHHCLDLADPSQSFSAADYVRAADAAIMDIGGRGKTPILSGGTAFYYMALLEGLFEGPAADMAIRAELEGRAEREGIGALHRELETIDPAAAAKIHPGDLRRIVRALEVARLTGDGISRRQRQWNAFHESGHSEGGRELFANPRHRFVMVRLVRDREDIHRRIRDRIARMGESGLMEEARGVYGNRATISRTPLQAVGYKELFPYFAGEATWSDCLEKLALATNRLVRKQETWFRKFPAREIAVGKGEAEEATAARILEVFANA